ncbi:MAG: autotransporter domain-containing protein [Verrucomicrobia bacterium]|nr:autotransporter domain-containing protein [Verrucomicrobiota bacterium]
MKKKLAIFISFLTFHLPTEAGNLGYTADYFSNTIFSFDLETGNFTPVIMLPPGIDLIDLQVFNNKTIYALAFGDRNLYAVDLKTNTYQQVTPTPIGDNSEFVYGVGIANATTAYVVGYQENKIYRVNLETGASTTLTTLAGNPGLTNIAIKNENIGYVVGYSDNNIYEVDLISGTYQLVTPVSIGFPNIVSPEGIALVGDNTAYVVSNLEGTVYEVDLQTGSYSLVTPAPILDGGLPAPLINLAAYQGMGYTVNNLSGQIYKVDLTNGSFITLTTIPSVALTGMTLSIEPAVFFMGALPPQIPLSNLQGNNLHLATYLNENAPDETISLFSILTTELNASLEAAAPTRNSSFTYGAQLGSLGFIRIINEHQRQKRFQHQTQGSCYCEPDGPYTVWIAPFGGYTEMQRQSQTPSFNMSVGGITAAFDYNGVNRNFFGFGASYLYTNLQEKHSAGHGHIDQGSLILYGTANLQHWYFDFQLSGGFYYSESVREIALPELNATAKSHPKGWQLAPSFEIGYNNFDFDSCTSFDSGASPFVLMNWVANWEQKLKENGAEGLNMGQKARFCSLLQAEAGVHFHQTAYWPGGKTMFQEKGAYSYQQAFGTGSLTAYLVGSPNYFTVSTLSKGQNLGVVEISMVVLPDNTKMPYVDIWYEGQFSDGYQLHQAVIELGKNF